MSIRSSLAMLFLLVVPVAVASQTPAAAPKPGPELRKFDLFSGKWNIEEQAQASVFGPGGALTSVETYEWMPGGFFMVHHWDAKQGSAEYKGMEVLGYDIRNKVYTSKLFDNTGNAGVWKATVQGNTWTWTGETDAAGKTVHERCTLTTTPPNAYAQKCEVSTDGVKWLPNFDQKATRAK
jgi:hypothetical protein